MSDSFTSEPRLCPYCKRNWISGEETCDCDRPSNQRNYVKEFREYADYPASSGMVPIHPDTLRGAADEIERLRLELSDCRASLDLFDPGHDSEYWLRHQPSVETKPTQTWSRHGVDCPKQAHLAPSGYLHAADDDGPYDVDGVTYCGRCHSWLER